MHNPVYACQIRHAFYLVQKCMHSILSYIWRWRSIVQTLGLWVYIMHEKMLCCVKNGWRLLYTVPLTALKTIWRRVCAKLALPWITSELWWISLVAACFSVHDDCICWCRTVNMESYFLPHTHTHTFLSHKWKGRSLIFPSQKAGTLVFTFQSLHPHHYSNSFSYFVIRRGCFSVISLCCL